MTPVRGFLGLIPERRCSRTVPGSFYFHRGEREAFLDRLRTRGTCPAEEVCLRSGTGVPVWVLTTRTVVSFVKDRPELLQGTVIDVTTQKKAQAKLRDIKHAEPSALIPTSESAQMLEISQKLAPLLQRVSKILQPNNLPRIDKAEIRECLLALEQVKMLMAELEVRRLLGE